MIPRYSRPAMAALWTEEAKLGRWLEVELEVCRAWAERGVIPADDLAAIEAGAGFSVERTEELERITHHDVVAFLTDVAERRAPRGHNAVLRMGVGSHPRHLSGRFCRDQGLRAARS